jgi:phage terminase small subunit
LPYAQYRATIPTCTKEDDIPGSLGGRKRKDPALKLAEGDRGHKGNKPDYSRNLVETPLGAPDMPDDMSDGAKAVWAATVPLLAQDPNLLSVVDTSVLRDFCEVEAQKNVIEAAMWEEAEAAADRAKVHKLAARARVLGDRHRQGMLDKLRMRAVVLRREIGASPVSRSSLKVGPIVTTKTIQAGDAMEDTFFGGSMQPC